MLSDDLRDRAARNLLSGRDMIRAKARGKTRVEAAREQYGADALEAAAAALDAPDAALTDDLLAALRDDGDLDDVVMAATGDGGAGDDGAAPSAGVMSPGEYTAQRSQQRENLGLEASTDVTPDAPPSADTMSASEYVEQRRRQRERAESNDVSTDAARGADELALAAMDGGDRIAAEQRGMDPAEYIRAEYGLTAAEYDRSDALHDDIIAQLAGKHDGRED
jgi:hypothetical protein